LSSLLHPLDFAQMSFKMPTNWILSGFPMVELFWIFANFCPKLELCLIFYIFTVSQYRFTPPPPPPPPKFLSFDLMPLWSLRGALSKFKMSSKLILKIISKSKLKGFEFNFHFFFALIFLWMMLNWSQCLN
jgi:hypothetical protein